jgi:protein-S-isoprenylcysteine O-methyltransferase Ste14
MQPRILTNDWFEQVVFDSLAWDVFARLLLLSVCAGLLYLSYIRLDQLMDDPGVSRWQVATAGLAIGNILLMAVLGAFRRRPVKRIHGLTQRIVALGGSWLAMFMIAGPMHKASPAMVAFGLALVIVGACFQGWTYFHLGRSFSMMAEARKLQTTGPYRFIRHPLYLFEEMPTLAFYLLNISLFNTVVLATQIAFQLQRMRYEERILEEAFPEYREFKLSRARLIPGVY